MLLISYLPRFLSGMCLQDLEISPYRYEQDIMKFIPESMKYSNDSCKKAYTCTPTELQKHVRGGAPYLEGHHMLD